jgi:tetratricopeptide (TPR) repeat protein
MLLFIDADETLHVRSAQLFRRMLQNNDCIVWWVRTGNFCFRKIAAVKLNLTICWVGAVHEYLKLSLEPIRGSEFVQRTAWLRYGHNGYRRRTNKSPKKDIHKLGSTKYRDNQGFFRSFFFAARTYEEYGDNETAILYFEKALSVSAPCSDDRWQALWGMCRTLGDRDLGRLADLYYKAHISASRRAEPLVALAAIARKQGQIAEAMSLAKAAISLPWPRTTTMIDASAYGWRAVDEVALAAYDLEDSDNLKLAIGYYKRLLRRREIPEEEVPRVKENLSLLASKVERLSSTVVRRSSMV